MEVSIVKDIFSLSCSNHVIKYTDLDYKNYLYTQVSYLKNIIWIINTIGEYD